MMVAKTADKIHTETTPNSWWCTTNQGMDDLVHKGPYSPSEFPLVVLGESFLAVKYKVARIGVVVFQKSSTISYEGGKSRYLKSTW